MTSPQQRPSRTRRLPKRYDVLSLYLLATLLGHVRSDFLSSEGVYFTKELPVTYSNSEWMISTEVTFAHMNEDIRVLRNYLQQRTWLDSNATESITQYVRSGSEENPNIRNQLRLLTHTQRATYDCLHTSNLLDDRLQQIINFTAGESPPTLTDFRDKRGMFNLGGDILKWIFGTVNNADLEDLHERLHNNAQLNSEIIHSVEEQASLVAENKRRTTANTEMMGEIQATLSNLLQLWYLVTPCDPENMWFLYQKIKVSTAVVRNPVTKEKRLKLFFHIPIYEPS